MQGMERWAPVLAVASMVVAVAVGAGCRSGLSWGGGDGGLKGNLTFHASFDRGTDAAYALGDPWIYSAPSMKRIDEARPGLPPPDLVKVTLGGGKYGGALRFEKKSDGIVYFKGRNNVPWAAQDWGGTVSFWLKTDFKELAEGYTDPIQVTPRAWNDAAFFVEFEKRSNSVPFRLGAYADIKVWNPDDRDWGTIPKPELPLITVSGPPFSGDRWTHVAFTWERFNTGKPEGNASLYLDGALIGTIRSRTQTFTWNPEEVRLMLGLGYVGWIDDVAVFRRALSAEEIQEVRALPHGIQSLLR